MSGPLIALLFQGGLVQAGTSTASILVVVNDSQTYKWGHYLEEILRAEGLNEYDVIDISAMTADGLSSYPVVILAQTSLTSGQASTLATYVNSGGRLIAMRPDAQIKALFGLGSSAGTQNNGYLAINTTATLDGVAPGAGLVTDTLQIHGTVDRYTPAGGTVTLAQLYSSASTATAYPAVVGATYGAGRGVAFLYDLSSNIIYMRQGNPTNATYVSPQSGLAGDVDGDGVFRTIDLFEAIGGGSPWVDLNKMPIPQADEQQRLFARLVKQMAASVEPLPQMWYFPGTAKSVLIPTGDAHNNQESDFQYEMDSVNAHGGKITIYLTSIFNQPPTEADVQTWVSEGDTFGIHPWSYKPDSDPDFNIASLEDGYRVMELFFESTYSNVTRSATVRNHQIAWEGWTSAAELAISYGIAMDTSFYNWGPWLQKPDGSWADGYVTGSGLPMKFVKADGTILPEYQQYTEIVDEQLMSAATNPGFLNENLTPAQALVITKAEIDASLGGYYSALMTQFHVDYYDVGTQPWAEGVMDYANSKGVPIWNADQWLSFTQTRHDANYSNIVWSGTNNLLTFNLVSSATPGVTLTTLLPLTYANRDLNSVSVDGHAVAFQQETINGMDVAFVSIAAGNHSFTAAYQPQGPKADVSVDINGSPDPVAAGSSLTYTINAGNSGPDSASGVTLTDTLPNKVSFASVSSSQGTCSGTTTIICNLGTLNVADAATITLKVTVDPSARGSLSNSATISSNEYDPLDSNNTGTASVAVNGQVDLDITKSDSVSPQSVIAGNTMAYSLNITNSGPSSATGVQVTDLLPDGVTYSQAQGSGWNCNASNGTVTCTRSSLGVTSTPSTITVNVTVNPDQTGSLANTAGVSSNEPDSTPGNNTSNTVTTNVIAQADLGISQSAAPSPVDAGMNLTYTLKVSNAGPSTAGNVIVTDTLPTQADYVSAGSSDSSWACGQASGVVTCTRTSLVVGDAGDISVVVKAPVAGGTLSNAVSVSADTSDPVAENNMPAALETSVLAADLSINGAGSPEPVPVGGMLTYALNVSNSGPSDASNVQVSYSLPAGVSYVGGSGTGWTCDQVSGVVTCTLTDALVAGNSSTLSLQVSVPDQTGSFTAVFEVSSATPEADNYNNKTNISTSVLMLYWFPLVHR